MLTDDPLPTLAFALNDARQRPSIQRHSAIHQHVVMFPQCWPANATQANGQHAPASELHTVVVMDEDGGASVYFGERLAYRVTAPNRRFFLDVAGQCMVPRHECGRYEGLDDDEVQSLDYCLEMNLCRWHAQIKCTSPSQCQLVARLLHGYAERFERDACQAELESTEAEAGVSLVP